MAESLREGKRADNPGVGDGLTKTRPNDAGLPLFPRTFPEATMGRLNTDSHNA